MASQSIATHRTQKANDEVLTASAAWDEMLDAMAIRVLEEEPPNPKGWMSLHRRALQLSLDAYVEAASDETEKHRRLWLWALAALETGEEPGEILSLLAAHPLGRRTTID